MIDVAMLGKTLSARCICQIVNALILTCILGFVAISSDHTNVLIEIYKNTILNFAKGDWYTYFAGHIPYPLLTPYLTFSQHCGLLVFALGLWYLLNLALLSACLLDFVVWLTGEDKAVVLRLAFIDLFICSSLGHVWGDYSLIAPEALSAYLVYPFALWSILFAAQLRINFSTVAGLIACLIHTAIAPLLFPTVIAVALIAQYPRIKLSKTLPLIAIFIASLCYLYFLSSANDGSTDPEVYKIFFYGRAPWHYAPQLLTIDIHLRSILVCAILAILCQRMPTSKALPIQITLLACIILFISGFLFISTYYYPLIIRAFPFRVFPLIVALVIAALVSEIDKIHANKMPHENFTSFVLVCLAFLSLQFEPYISLFFLGLAILGTDNLRRRLIFAKPTLLTLLAILSPLILLTLINMSFRHPGFVIKWPPEQLVELGKVVQANTEPGDIIITPPTIDGLRIVLNRAIVVDFKCLPVYGDQIVEWARRMEAITGIDPSKIELNNSPNVFDLPKKYEEGFRSRPYKDLLNAATIYGAKFIITYTDSIFYTEMLSKVTTSPIWKSDTLALFKLNT